MKKKTKKVEEKKIWQSFWRKSFKTVVHEKDGFIVKTKSEVDRLVDSVNKFAGGAFHWVEEVKNS